MTLTTGRGARGVGTVEPSYCESSFLCVGFFSVYLFYGFVFFFAVSKELILNVYFICNQHPFYVR